MPPRNAHCPALPCSADRTSTGELGDGIRDPDLPSRLQIVDIGSGQVVTAVSVGCGGGGGGGGGGGTAGPRGGSLGLSLADPEFASVARPAPERTYSAETVVHRGSAPSIRAQDGVRAGRPQFRFIPAFTLLPPVAAEHCLISLC